MLSKLVFAQHDPPHAQTGLVQTCIRQGADDFLTKPVCLQSIEGLWHHCFRRQADFMASHSFKHEHLNGPQPQPHSAPVAIPYAESDHDLLESGSPSSSDTSPFGISPSGTSPLLMSSQLSRPPSLEAPHRLKSSSPPSSPPTSRESSFSLGLSRPPTLQEVSRSLDSFSIDPPRAPINYQATLTHPRIRALMDL